MASVKAVLCFLLAIPTLYLYSLLYIIPSIIILPFSIKYCGLLADQLLFRPFAGFFAALLELVFRVKIVLSGDINNKFSDTRPTLIILNHRYRSDWSFVFGLLFRLGSLAKNKVVMKNIFGSLPIIGWAFSMIMPVFVQQSRNEDENTIRDTINYYHDMSLPVQLLMCPEGTALNTANRLKDDNFAKKNGLDLYKYIMHPRTKGFVELVNALKIYKEFDICNVTLGYVGGNISHDPGKEEFTGQLPSEIHCKVETVPFSVFSSFTDKELEEWLKKEWRDKEDCLKRFYQTNSFTESGPVYKDDWTVPMKLMGFIIYGIVTFTVFLYYLPWTIIIVSIFGIISYCVHSFKGGWSHIILNWNNNKKL